MKKILLIDDFHSSFGELLLPYGFVCEDGTTMNRQEIMDILPQYNGVAIRSRIEMDADMMEKGEQLRFIARGGAGMESIDVNYAQRKGIVCFNAPEGNRDAVAEHAVMLLLSLMNNLLRADREVRMGKWNREENRGEELQGKTVGIIGFGNMGRAFAHRLKCFDVTEIAYDPYIEIDPKVFPEVKQVDWEELLYRSDVISLHVPLTDQTERMINADFFNALEKPIWFMNTARGKVVDTQALMQALQSGKVKGAGLDVLEYEKKSFESFDQNQIPEEFNYLIQSDKVVLTPHIAGWSFESYQKISAVLANKIIREFGR